MKNHRSRNRCFQIATWQVLILNLLLLATAPSAKADTTWVAAGSVSGLWHSGGSPYIISEGDIDVWADSSLLILEGVEINFTDAFTFRIHGLLEAEGTEADSIYFTCNPDSTPGGWRGLRFNSSQAGCELSYCVIERGNGNGPFDLRYGGGVEVQSCSPSFTNCTFRNNHAILDGGGVYARDGGAPEFHNCLFEGNAASIGGGMLSRAQASPLLTDCVFLGNSALSGGGVAVESLSDMILTNCQFENNSADLGGGFKCNYSSATPVLSNCIFRGNSADSSGSAVYLKGTDAKLQHCLMFENEANGESGGTIHADTTDARIYNSIIANSLAGSGIHLNNASELTVSGCDFFENAGGAYSGDALLGFGIPVRQNLNFDSCDVHFNIFENPRFRSPGTGDFHLMDNSPCIAGGTNIILFPADPEGNSRPLPQSTFPDQGVFEHAEGSPLLLCGELSGLLDPGEYAVICDLVVPPGEELVIDRETSILFAGDYKIEVRGALSTRGTAGLRVTFSRYFDNDSFWGGIEFIESGNLSNMRYTTIEFAHINSNASRLHGGAIYLNRSSPTLEECVIRDCEALLTTSEGGAIFVGSDSDPLISKCRIENCRATIKGGGISIASNRRTIIDSCEIVRNESNLLGGGVYLHLSEASISASTISNNLCLGKGGGIYSWWSPVEISNCFIVNNTSNDKGGGIYVNSSSPFLMNCTIGGNLAGNGGGGVTLNQSTAKIKNSIVFGSIGSGIEFTLNNSGSTIEYSDVFGNDPENYSGLENGPVGLDVVDTTNFNGDESDIFFNISVDPLFADTSDMNYQLTAGSHCINAGDPLGELDPDTTIADIGAMYFPVEHNPSTAFNLISPPDESGADEANLVLIWEASLDEGTTDLVPLYRLQIAEDAELEDIVLSQTIEDTTITITTLEDSTNYWWRILAIGSNGIARTSNQIWTFYTVITNPSTPFELLFPIDQDTMSVIESRLFCWEESHEYDGGDFVVYTMNLESVDTLVTFSDLTDTCLNIVPTILGLNETGWIEWWVEASSNDPDTTIECEERFHFWLQDTTSSIAKFSELPNEFALHVNFPNPFNAVTTIGFEIPVDAVINLSVVNIMGQQVAQLVSDRLQPGVYQVEWNASGYSSGVYLAVMQTNRQRWITKMMLLK